MNDISFNNKKNDDYNNFIKIWFLPFLNKMSKNDKFHLWYTNISKKLWSPIP